MNINSKTDEVARETAMKAIFFHIFALVCLCGSATCGIFDDPKTVTKARCYANCITLVSFSIVHVCLDFEQKVIYKTNV